MSFLISLLPDWIFYSILILGILILLATLVLQMIPFIKQYLIPLQVISVLLIVSGTWFAGGISVEKRWLEKVNEMKLRIAEAERQAAETSAKIEYIYVDKVKVIKDTQYIIQSEIREWSNDIDANCKVNPRVVEILNRSATMENKQ